MLKSSPVLVGSLGEMAFESHFFKEGYLIAAPRFDLFKVDFILEWDNTLVKVQVKTMSRRNKSNSYSTNLSTTRGGNKWQAYTPDEIDYFGVVNLDYGNIWLIPVDATKDKATLTWIAPKLRQHKRQATFNWDKYLIK